MVGPAEPLRLDELARLVSGWAAAEVRFYEVVGGWAATSGPAAVKVHFDVCSQHHAWRAQIWQERLLAIQPDACPVGRGAEEAFSALAALEGGTARLTAYCRAVLERVMTSYRSWQPRLSSASERPVERALALVLEDTARDWREGTALLAEIFQGPDGERAVKEAGQACASVELRLVGGGWLQWG
jgi:hypothetical protein